MAKAKNKKEKVEEVTEFEQPMFPLTVDGVKFMVQLIDFAASKGAIPIDQYLNVHNTYASAINFLAANGELERGDDSDQTGETDGE